MTEREMKYSQGVLVTGSFEEGHFHQGILALNQLRMPGITPSPYVHLTPNSRFTEVY